MADSVVVALPLLVCDDEIVSPPLTSVEVDVELPVTVTVELLVPAISFPDSVDVELSDDVL